MTVPVRVPARRPESQAQARLTPVLEIGGTHVTAALIDTRTWSVAGDPSRHHIDSGGTANEILLTFAVAAAELSVPPEATWSVAVPGPFDYVRGIGRFRGVAKFEALNGVSVRDELLLRLPAAPDGVVFLNDGDAFALGEWVCGAGSGAERTLGLTLGTGVGSGWITAGRIAELTDPPGGRAHLLQVDGLPLEDTMSRRAIRRAYMDLTGSDRPDVAEIAGRARAGEPAANQVLAHALGGLGRALARPVQAFGTDVIVVGGSMARSWDLFEPWFAAGLGPGPVTKAAASPDTAPLIGAAWFGAGISSA